MLKGRSPTKAEAEHMERVRALGCIVCLKFYGVETPAEIHHINGRSDDGCHFWVLPLCAEHHRGYHKGPDHYSRHPYKAQFEKAYGKEFELLKEVNEMMGKKQ